MSLTTTAKNVKIGFVLFLAFMFIYLLGSMVFVPMTQGMIRSLFPPKNPPNPVFGVLEPLEFEPARILNTNAPKYTLFTSDGRLPPDLPQKATVYKYGSVGASFEAGKRAARTANTLGFKEENLTTNLKGDEYKWIDPKTGASLEIKINTKELILQTPVTSLSGAYSEGSMDAAKARVGAKNVLRNIGRFSDPLYTKGDQTVEFGSVETGRITHASYSGEAEIAYVNFFRSIDEVPIVGPTYNKGLVRLQIGDSKNNKILYHPYIYYNVRPIHTQSNATYPLIPIKSAWEGVSQNKGVISYVKPNTQTVFEEYRPTRISEILINNIFLAYYDDTEEQKYLQPIYVFEGNYIGSNNEKGSIAIYYPAILGEYIANSKSE